VMALRDALLTRDELIGQEILDVIVAAAPLALLDDRDSDRVDTPVA
jgi:hypothetical protein